MTTAAILEQYNTERPNSIEDYVKLGWLLKCEKMIVEEIILTHEDAPEVEELEEHLDTFDMDTELLLEEPDDDLYMHFLDQRLAFNNNDTKRFNMASTMYNNALLSYKQKYNRKHMALKERKQLFRHEVL